MNEHNPIALAISLLQEKWKNSLTNQDYTFLRWVIKKDQLDIFKAFLKLESTPYGSLQETIIVLFTPFESSAGFAYSLANDWLQLFEQEMAQGKLPVWEDFAALKQEFSNLLPSGNYEGQDLHFLIKVLKSFKKYEGKKEKLMVGLFPNALLNHKDYNQWLQDLLPQLPANMAILMVDFAGKETLTPLFNHHHPERKTIPATELYDAAEIYRQLATYGNPNDSQVVFRTCLFEMGDAAKKGHKNGVYHWGNTALLTAQASGDKLFWASAHIIYAGFLFGFKDTDKIESLINTGLQICQPLLDDPAKKMATVGLLAQFFGYKASYLNILKKHKESIYYFQQQADILVQHDQAVLSIGAYQNALWVAHKHQRSKVAELAAKGFAAGYPLEDEILRTSGFPLIAHYYLQNDLANKDQKEEIEKRLNHLYGPEWKANAKKHLAIAPQEFVS